MISLEAERLEPTEGRVKRLVVLLHGYGSDGKDLIDLAQAWREGLPETAFTSFNAPQPCDVWPDGRQWFPLSARDPVEYWRGSVSSAPILDNAISEEMVRLGLTEQQVVLFGFSQGAILALHIGLRRAQSLAGIVSYSGLLAGPNRLGNDLLSKPPTLIVHGRKDDVLPAWHCEIIQKRLQELNVPVECHILPELGHGIDERCVVLGQMFLRKAFGFQLSRSAI